MRFLASIVVNASSHTKYLSLSNQNSKIQPTFINLHPNKYSQELHYYRFAFSLGICVGSCNTLNNLSNKVEDLNLTMSNIITGINELKTLTKRIYNAIVRVNLKLLHVIVRMVNT